MKNVPENELFSAYLDGELTAEEEQQVEQLVAESPAARQLLEELASLSGALQNLPSHKLNEDLAPRILQKAEQRMLREPAPDRRYRSNGKHSNWTTPSDPNLSWHPRRLLNPRAWSWPAVAVAIGLALMFLKPGGEQPANGPQVAHRLAEDAGNPPPTIESATDHPEEAASPAADRRAETARIEPVADEKPPESTARKPNARSDKSPVAAASEEVAPASPQATPEAAMGPSEPAVESAPVPADIRSDEPAEVQQPQRSAAPEPQKERPTGPEPRSVVADEPEPGVKIASESSDEQRGAVASEKAGPAEGAVPSEAQMVGRERREADQPAPAAGSSETAPAPALKQPIEGVLVVQCDVRPKAARMRAFDRILARQQIAWHDPPADVAEQLDGVTAESKQADTPSTPKAAEQPRDQALAHQAAAEALDVVYVEATTEQVHATLAELARRPEQFAAVLVEPHPSQVAQQPFRRYSRTEGELAPPVDAIAGRAAGKSSMADKSIEGEAKTFSFQLGRAKRLNVPPAGFAAPAGAAGGTVAADGSEARRSAATGQGVRIGGGFSISAKVSAKPAKAKPKEKPSAEQRTERSNEPEKKADVVDASTTNTHRVLFVLRVVESDDPPSPSESADRPSQSPQQ